MSSFPSIATERLLLTLPPPSAAPRLLAYQLANRDHFAPWSPPHPEGFYSEGYWRWRLQAARDEYQAGRSLRLVIARRDLPDDGVIGDCNFTDIMRGAFQACYLGYELDRDAVGKGFMTEALRAALAHVFDELKLHRVMANYIPTNQRSARLLARLGFTIEGHARDYLYIAGAWRDHVMTALLNPRPITP